MEIEDFFRWVVKHPIVAVALLGWIGAAIARKFKLSAAAQEKPRAPRGGARSQGSESELEARVRRNFEEMMRRRGAAPAASAAAREPSRREEPRPRKPRAIVDYDERARPEPTSTEGPRAKVVVQARKGEAKPSKLGGPAARILSGTVRSAANARSDKRQRVGDLKRDALDHKTLRRALILREILDPPLALRQ